MAMRPSKEKPAKRRKVPDEPRPSVKLKKVELTMRFDTQLHIAAIPPPTPLNLSGYISEFTIHGAVPIPGEYDTMYAPRSITAKNPNLLGHPFVYQTRPSALHASFRESSPAKHAPGG